MRRTLLLFIIPFIVLTACSKPQVSSQDNVVSIKTDDGTISVTALSQGALRVRYVPEGTELPELEELVYTRSDVKQSVVYNQFGNTVSVSTPESGLTAKVNTRTGQTAFFDSNGKLLLSEVKNSRSVIAGRTGQLNSLSVSQSFVTGSDEYLFGTGQFQDRYIEGTAAQVIQQGIRNPVEQLRPD